MKKHLLTLSASVVLGLSLNAQNDNASLNANTQWKINGNTASSTDFMGTTNDQSLIFKTNNIKRVTFDTQGRSIFDGGGEVIIRPGELHRPIPTNPIAAYMLKVGGSGIFEGELNSRQLFVQEYITYMKSLKGPRIDVDTIRMDSTRGIYGHTKVFGDVNIKQNLLVEGNTTLKGDLITEKGFTFDGTKGIKYLSSSTGDRIIYGRTNDLGPSYACAAAPWQPINHTFNGWMQIFDSNNPEGSGLLNFQTWTTGSSIDASIGGSRVSRQRLLLNYFCGNDTYINTGWDLNATPVKNGGRVVMGPEVLMQRSLKIGWVSNTDEPIDDYTSLEINQNNDYAVALKVNTNKTNVAAFAISNSSIPVTNPFVVWGDGQTTIMTTNPSALKVNDPATDITCFHVSNKGVTNIGKGRPLATGIAKNAMLTVDGLILAKEVRVSVSTTTHWADYVFDKDYKLKNLYDVEAYITKNKHLPDVPSAQQVVENGVDMTEMNATLLKKIEELTLYTIELKKQLDKQQKEINSLKNN